MATTISKKGGQVIYRLSDKQKLALARLVIAPGGASVAASATLRSLEKRGLVRVYSSYAFKNGKTVRTYELTQAGRHALPAGRVA